MPVDLGRGDTEAIHSAVNQLTPAAMHRATHGPDVRLPTVLSIADLIDGAVDDAARWIDAIGASPALAERARAVGHPARRAWLAFERGHLDEALQLADMSLVAAGTEQRGAANAMIELFMVKSMVASERQALDEAEVSADRANELAAVLGAPVYIQLVDAAALTAVETRSGAAAALSAAIQLERADAPPPVRDRHRLVTAGIAARAGDWARAERLVADIRPCAMRTLVTARVAIGRGRPEAAVELLNGIDASGWPHRRVIEVDLLQHSCRPGDTAHLRHALELGVGNGYATSYLREDGVDRPTLRRLVDAQPGWRDLPLAGALGTQPAPVPSGPFVLVEPLSARELEVLQLLPTHLSTVEMAQRMFVSAHTVRTHVKAVYRKLAVNSRSEAVRRAAALGLTGATEPQC
jgi:LuxR family maltose regulon positive regulatory protein